MTKADKTQPNKTKPLAGGVRHDARGNAVWQWATETARHAVASTSQLLRRLDVSSLSLEDDESSPKPQARPVEGKPAQATPNRKVEGGFNPYDGATVRAPAAVKKRPPAPPAARASWWRGLFQRR